ncbi:hypothetical protein ABIC99_000068 [Sphaerotilus sulfidivorans]|jgi:hypothetical protein|uniref:Chemotaxis protein n=2 Tax=Sphaerotilus TaxID=34102 RepID=A0A5C1Q399_9BURK|nr:MULTISPECIES: chemotaxis protein [Sphaerotilaceae]NRT55222.1 hypothetical protein [Leptothrix sp. C29]NZD44511.1 chemotaxis protein [Sphaerotilus sulfidivorans]QEN01309.1 chemotaxis protein [Sphaerotilus sulfidivorans]
MSESPLYNGVPGDAFEDDLAADLLGPSDSSDSGSDLQGAQPLLPDAADGELLADRLWPEVEAAGSDAVGTGERATADGNDPVSGQDILPDRIIEPDDFGGVDPLGPPPGERDDGGF